MKVPRRPMGAIIGIGLLVAACAAPAVTLPGGSPPPLGPMDLRLVTQCGLTTIEVAGHVWAFDEQHQDEAPTGFTRPFDDGTFTVVDGEHATYRSARGFEVTLTRGGEPPPDCL